MNKDKFVPIFFFLNKDKCIEKIIVKEKKIIVEKQIVNMFYSKKKFLMSYL